MHHPESHYSDDRADDEHDPRDAIGNCVESLAVKKRGVRASWRCQAGKRDQRSEAPAVSTPRTSGSFGGHVLRLTFHDWFSPCISSLIAFVETRKPQIHSLFLPSK